MNRHRNLASWLVLLCAIIGLTACGSRGGQNDEARIETRVAEELAVAATLTANASAADVATDSPTDTPVMATEAAAAATEPPPTPIPPTAAPAATATPVVLGFLPVDGDDGNDFLRSSFDENQGRVVLFPGFSQAEISAPMVFRDRIALRIEVFDTRMGLTDGAGIQQVTFTLEDANGNVVYTHTEETPSYCNFGGGEPDCNVLTFEETNFQWPDGGEILNGEHLAKIDIEPENGEGTEWRVRFVVDVPGRGAYTEPPAPEPNTVRIDNIREEDDRYVVDFETVGFEPTLPGQHVHFFWNTVPPDQAGRPGDGPWQLYPAGNGESGESPFTLFRPYDRPGDATQICILVANPDHSVIQGSGNCLDLPDGG